MFDVTNFVMRWLFLCNLIRDVAEIQTLPYNPQPPPPIQQIQEVATHPVSCEEEWKDNCLRGILSYPPGSHRVFVMDALREELVQKLYQSLKDADRTLKYYEQNRRRLSKDSADSDLIDDGDSDPFLKEDLEMLRALEEAAKSESSIPPQGAQADDHRQAQWVIGNNSTTIDDSTEDEETSNNTQSSSRSYPSLLDEDIRPMPSPEEVREAQRTIRHVRDYLPQLVSLVLKSPQAFDQNLLDPVQELRHLIIQRCLEDPNWGIDLCWLLEAEVGRTWKNLFEHRQQAGKRLIIVLPAEKAAVLAKIGHERKEAFDFLQDAEQATAYGYTISMDEELKYQRHHQAIQYGAQQQHYPQEQHPQPPQTTDIEHASPARLPPNLSLRRCRHFGDTMHFIDRLTKISMDLTHVPTIHRHDFLLDSLREMNRRLRRRMVTYADVSLDVEDHRGPYDWPYPHDITADMLRYSVHLPVDPSSRARWPGADSAEHDIDNGVVRVLNIIVEESRILSSRERCPYLIHVEVADTGLRGSDERLFDCVHDLGAALEAMNANAASSPSTTDSTPLGAPHQPFAAYSNPHEHLAEPLRPQSIQDADYSYYPQSEEGQLPRGGWQGEEATYYDQNADGMYYADPYDMVRQNELEQLHQQMYNVRPPPPPPPPQQVAYSTKEDLLSMVFGQPWAEKCEEIRQASPYGHVKGWRLASFIMKAGEDIRQEALAMQIIQKLNEWFQSDIPESDRPHLRPYTIMCVGGDAGVVECLSDAKSIDELKKRTDGFESLRKYFERAYGYPSTHSYQAPDPSGSLTFEQAQDNFLRSLVGYSLICYILQIKDRHNANILLARDGSLIHIDFGFLLGETPKMGKVPIFSERAPFKLSQEFWDVLGGWNIESGGLGVRFCQMFEQAFECAAAHCEEIASLVEGGMLALTQNPRVAAAHANGVRSRLKLRGPPQSKEQKMFVMELVNAALTSWGTSTYDWLQKNMNGYQ